MTKYGTDYVPGCTYSISRILDVFTEVLQNTWNINLINEIIVSVSTLLMNKKIDLTFEWDQILNIIEVLFKQHTKLLINNKKLTEIESIFKHAQDKILTGKYIRDEVRLLKLYVKVRQDYMMSKQFKDVEIIGKDIKKMREQFGIPKPNLTILSLYIDHVLFEQFHDFENLVLNLFSNEVSYEVKMLLFEKIHQFYKESNNETRAIVEDIMLDLYKIVFFETKNSGIQLKCIDMLAYMCSCSKDENHFYSMMNLLTLVGKHDDSSEMTANQSLSLKRRIQIFKLKVATIESYKSVYTLTIFMEEFKNQSMAKREIILQEIV